MATYKTKVSQKLPNEIHNIVFVPFYWGIRVSFSAAAGLAQSLELLSAAREVAGSIPGPGQYSGEKGATFALQTARPSRYSDV